MPRLKAAEFPWSPDDEVSRVLSSGSPSRSAAGSLPASSESATALEAWACSGPKATKKRASSVSDAKLLELVDEMNVMLASGRWRNARPEHFVALIADLHFRVYGIVDSTLTPTKRGQAKGLAKRMLENEFDGDAMKMSEFVRWLWSREKSKEQYRREKGIANGRRLDWRGTFASYQLVDWKLAQHRTASNAASRVTA